MILRAACRLLLAGFASSCADTTSNTAAGRKAHSDVAGVCSLDSDCATGSLCRGGACTPRECTVTADCLSPLVCVTGQCVGNTNATGACMASDECPPPYQCDGFTKRCVNPATGEFLGGSSSSAGAAVDGTSAVAGGASSAGVLPPASRSSSSPGTSSSRGVSSSSSTPPPATASVICSGTTCVSDPSPLPSNVTAAASWNPCAGGSFSWTADGDFETGFDLGCVGGTATAGLASGCSGGTTLNGFGPWEGTATGTITVSVATDGSFSSTGLTYLVATCGGTSTTGSVTCMGLTCSSSPSPLPNQANASTSWNPCAGGPFNWAANGQFESGFDRGCVGGTATAGSSGDCGGGSTLSGSGPWSGTATGSVTVSVATDGTLSSTGLTSLTATCTVPPAITCTGTQCSSSPSPLPGSTVLSTSWNPCQGGAFSWTAAGQFESGYDRACVGGTATAGFSGSCSAGTLLMGAGPWSGSANGPVTVSLATDGSINSTGLTSLVATCAAGSSSSSGSGSSSSVSGP